MMCFFFFSQGFARADGLEKAGDVIQILNPLAALSISYAKEDYEGIKQLAKTSLFTIAATKGLKYALNDVEINGTRLGERPNGSDHNFPSGHTSWTFSSAWYLHKRYNYSLKYSIIPLAGAVLTGYSRIHARKHDAKAVFAGAALGILSAEIFTNSIDQTMNLQYSSKDGLLFHFNKEF